MVKNKYVVEFSVLAHGDEDLIMENAVARCYYWINDNAKKLGGAVVEGDLSSARMYAEAVLEELEEMEKLEGELENNSYV